MNGHAIITGGSSGIGLAFARLLLTKELSVSLISRSAHRLNAAKAELAADFPATSIGVFVADVGDEQALAAAIVEATSAFGRPNWAIASAGIVEPGLFEDQSSTDCVRQMQTNFLGAVHFAKAVIPLMKGSEGHLLFVGSAAAFAGIHGYATYGASKFAVRGLAESLRVELADTGIAVTLACPGDTDTPQLRYDVARRPAATREIAGGHVMNAEDVARLAIASAERGKFLVTFGPKHFLLSRLHGLFGGVIRRHQERIARRLAERAER